MRAERKAVFLLFLICLNGISSLASLQELSPEKYARFKQFQEVQNDLEANGKKIAEHLKSGIQLLVEDVLEIPSLQAQIKQPMTNLAISVSEAGVKGLSQTTIESIDVDMMKSKVSVMLRAPRLIIEGMADIQGNINTNSISSAHKIRQTMTEVEISCDARLDISNGLKIEPATFSSQIGGSQVVFEGLSGKDGVLINKIRQSAAKELSEAVLPFLHKMLDGIIMPQVSSQLAPLNHCSLAPCALEAQLHPKYLAQVRANINELIDSLLATASEIIVATGLDPMTLPDFGLKFTIFWFIDIAFGLFDGFLEGLSHLVRAGDWYMRVTGITTSTIEGLLGLLNLHGQYTWKATTMGIGVYIDYGAAVANVDVDVKFEVNILSMAVTMERFEITNVGTVDIIVDGIFLFDWLVELIAEFMVNLFLDLIVDVVEGIIRDIIEDLLQSSAVIEKIILPVLEKA